MLKSVWTDVLSIVSVFGVNLFSKNSYFLLFTLSEPCLDMLNTLITVINFRINLLGVCPNHILNIHCVHTEGICHRPMHTLDNRLV